MISLPHDLETERTVLGAMLQSEQACNEAKGRLKSEHFHAESHRAIFRALEMVTERGQPADIETACGLLRQKHALERAGGAAYISGLVDGVPKRNLTFHFDRLLDLALKRSLSLALGSLAEKASGDEPGQEIAQEALQTILGLLGKSTTDKACDNRELAKQAIRDAEERAQDPDGILGYRFGIPELDQLVQGFGPGLGVIGGRLSSGKSILALQIAERLARTEEGHVAFFSLEMSGRSLMNRRIAGESGVSLNRLFRTYGGDGDTRWSKLAKAVETVSKPDLEIYISPGLTLPRLRSKCKQIQSEHGLSMIAVDYLQLMKPMKSRTKRDEELEDIANGLKEIAMDLGVPVITPSQLNRESEKEVRPMMRHLSGSDAIGKAADWTILIQREPPPDRDADALSTRGLADLYVGKNRDGFDQGKVRVKLNAFVQRFESMPAEPPA